MDSEQMFFLSMVVAVFLILLGLVKNKTTFLLKLFSRGVVGIFAICFINAFFCYTKISLNLGINIYTICTTALLGVPGLTLLYGILGCQFL